MIGLTVLFAISSFGLGEPKSSLILTDVKHVQAGYVMLEDGTPFTIEATLKNTSKSPIRIWDPKNTEGSMCLYAIAIDGKGVKTKLESLPIPRAAGVPTSVVLGPGQSSPLIASLRWALDQARLDPGSYKVVLAYGNAIADSGPVKGVWTGKVFAKSIAIRFVK